MISLLWSDDFNGLAHHNRGCPINSICGKMMGEKKARWDDFLIHLPKNAKKATKLLEFYRKKNGILLPIWSISDNSEEQDLIKWNSPCPNHPKNDRQLYLSAAFITDFSLLDNSRFISEIALLLKDHSVVTYPIPNREIPLYIEGKDMIFSISSEGSYFHIAIGPSGKIRVVSPAKTDYSFEDTQCPSILSNKFTQLNQGLYQGSFCRKIYNTLSKNYQVILFGLTCV